MESKTTEIIEILQPLCPTIDLKHPSSKYYTSCIDEMIEVFKRIDNPRVLCYPESVRVDILNNVVEHIKTDFLGQEKVDYLWQDDKPENDYERGVLNVIRLIQFRVHCICDY